MPISCSICLKNIQDVQAATIPCGHVFDAICITQCLQKRESCPTCNKPCTLHDMIVIHLTKTDNSDDVTFLQNKIIQLTLELQQVDNLKKINQLQENEIDALKSKLANANSGSIDNNFKAAYDKQTLEITNLKNVILSKSNSQQNFENKCKNLEDKCKNLSRKLKDKDRQKDDNIREIFEQQYSETDELQREIDDLESQVSRLEKQVDKAEKERDAAVKKFDDLRTRVKPRPQQPGNFQPKKQQSNGVQQNKPPTSGSQQKTKTTITQQQAAGSQQNTAIQQNNNIPQSSPQPQSFNASPTNPQPHFPVEHHPWPPQSIYTQPQGLLHQEQQQQPEMPNQPIRLEQERKKGEQLWAVYVPPSSVPKKRKLETRPPATPQTQPQQQPQQPQQPQSQPINYPQHFNSHYQPIAPHPQQIPPLRAQQAWSPPQQHPSQQHPPQQHPPQQINHYPQQQMSPQQINAQSQQQMSPHLQQQMSPHPQSMMPQPQQSAPVQSQTSGQKVYKVPDVQPKMFEWQLGAPIPKPGPHPKLSPPQKKQSKKPATTSATGSKATKGKSKVT